MTRMTFTSLACGAAMIVASATATLAQTPGNGSTGNAGTNDPAKVQGSMMKHKASAKMPRCTTHRTKNCRHHAGTMMKSM